ncbi:MAG: YraN family protein [Alphaproteobacteria bacterium]|nr:YraN family protein [Alphaproteobacteria bacterium]
MANSKQVAHQWGVEAEALAAEFLRHKGYRILAERWRTGAGEIDVLAAENSETLVVVEVKARQKTSDGLWSVTPAKQKRLVRAAEVALSHHEKFTGLAPLTHLNIRFDVVIITPDNAPEHLINAWQVE